MMAEALHLKGFLAPGKQVGNLANSFTSHAEVDSLLAILLEEVQAVLGEQFIGMYLDGSLASGDFDAASDIDFVVVTREDITGELFLRLQAMHDRIAALDSPWAIQLEGSYVSLPAIRRYDPEHALHPNIERGLGERLKWVDHNEPWNVHRSVLRERGITLLGPAPCSLVDPVSAQELRAAMLVLLNGWAQNILDNPQVIARRGYQSYVVLSLCRVFYTLQTGQVASKPSAAAWAEENLAERWIPLIDRAWEGRHHPELPADPDDFRETLKLILYSTLFSKTYENAI
jgi:predicted nucleotidyltransferase